MTCAGLEYEKAQLQYWLAEKVCATIKGDSTRAAHAEAHAKLSMSGIKAVATVQEALEKVTTR